MTHRLPARLAAVAAAALAVVALGACQPRPATAAYVGDTRISLADVEDLYRQAASDPLSAPIVERFPGEVRTEIVQTLVRTEVLRRAADQENLRVTDADVSRVRRVLGAQREQLQPAQRVVPLDALAPNQAYITAFQDRVNAGAADEQEAQGRATAIIARTLDRYPVTLNPRFGGFDAAQFAIVAREGSAVRPLATPSAAP